MDILGFEAIKKGRTKCLIDTINSRKTNCVVRRDAFGLLRRPLMHSGSHHPNKKHHCGKSAKRTCSFLRFCETFKRNGPHCGRLARECRRKNRMNWPSVARRVHFIERCDSSQWPTPLVGTIRPPDSVEIQVWPAVTNHDAFRFCIPREVDSQCFCGAVFDANLQVFHHRN